MPEKMFVQRLEEAARSRGSIVCVGLDPVNERIPVAGASMQERISRFYIELLEGLYREGFGAAKPNYAFFAQYGFEGLRALKGVIDWLKARHIPVILDGKRGDIGSSSAAYAREAFSFWKADATTVSPYLGSDSVKPFLDYAKKGFGTYVLVRTSNPSAKEVQGLSAGGKKVYERVAELALDWHRNAKGNCGVVVGATAPLELRRVCRAYAQKHAVVPFLVPGIGTQGGALDKSLDALWLMKDSLASHRINSSSGISYAFEKRKSRDFVGAAADELRKLNKAIGEIE